MTSLASNSQLGRLACFHAHWRRGAERRRHCKLETDNRLCEDGSIVLFQSELAGYCIVRSMERRRILHTGYWYHYVLMTPYSVIQEWSRAPKPRRYEMRQLMESLEEDKFLTLLSLSLSLSLSRSLMRTNTSFPIPQTKTNGVLEGIAVHIVRLIVVGTAHWKMMAREYLQ
jgi:hypothetical protein